MAKLFPTNCKIRKPGGLSSVADTRFLTNSIYSEDNRLKKIHLEDIRQTNENPRVRDENELSDIAQELRKQKHNELVERTKRRQLWESNEELRELANQLKAAYIMKSLHDQKLADENAKRTQQAIEYAEGLTIVDQMRKEDAAERKLRFECETKKKLEFRQNLQKQIQDHHKKRIEELYQTENDRIERAKLNVILNAEREKDGQNAVEQKLHWRKETKEFLEQKAMLKAREELEQKLEDQRIREIQMIDDERKRLQKEEEKRKIQNNIIISEAVAKKLEERYETKNRREELLTDLLVEERYAKEDEKYFDSLKKRHMARIQLREHFQQHSLESKILKEKLRMEEQELELKEIEHMKALFCKREALENECKLQTKERLRTDLQTMIEMNRKKRAEDAKLHLINCEHMNYLNCLNDELIANERKRVLQTQPIEVLKLLPKGVLRDSELEFLPLKPQKPKEN